MKYILSIIAFLSINASLKSQSSLVELEFDAFNNKKANYLELCNKGKLKCDSMKLLDFFKSKNISIFVDTGLYKTDKEGLLSKRNCMEIKLKDTLIKYCFLSHYTGLENNVVYYFEDLINNKRSFLFGIITAVGNESDLFDWYYRFLYTEKIK